MAKQRVSIPGAKAHVGGAGGGGAKYVANHWAKTPRAYQPGWNKADIKQQMMTGGLRASGTRGSLKYEVKGGAARKVMAAKLKAGRAGRAGGGGGKGGGHGRPGGNPNHGAKGRFV